MTGINKQNLAIGYFLGLVTFFFIWPYYSVFLGLHNSLKFNTFFIILLIPIILIYPLRFIRYLYFGKFSFLILIILLFFILDLFINSPINKYKFDTYSLFVIILVFSFFFKLLNQKHRNLIVLYCLFFWFITSILEFYLRWQYPILFEEVWRGLTLQSGVQESDFEVKKIHGLGISTQANVTAIFSFMFFIFYFLQNSYRYFSNLLLIFLLLVVLGLLPLMLSLTSILGLLLTIFIYYLKKSTRLSGNLIILLIFSIFIFSWPVLFSLGEFFNFSANKESQSDYLYEFIVWPSEFLFDNLPMILSGMLNDISTAPLENKYFDLLLTNGLLIFLLLIIILYKMYINLLNNIVKGKINTLKFFLFSNLIISYFHISFLPHITTLILFSILFVYAVMPLNKIPLDNGFKNSVYI